MFKRKTKNENLVLEEICLSKKTNKSIVFTLLIVGIVIPLLFLISFLFVEVVTLRTSSPIYYAWQGVDLLRTPFAGPNYLHEIIAAELFPTWAEVPAESYIKIDSGHALMFFLFQKVLWLRIALDIFLCIVQAIKSLPNKKYASMLNYTSKRVSGGVGVITVGLIGIFILYFYINIIYKSDEYLELMPNWVFIAALSVFNLIYYVVKKVTIKTLSKKVQMNLRINQQYSKR